MIGWLRWSGGKHLAVERKIEEGKVEGEGLGEWSWCTEGLVVVEEEEEG